MQRRPKFSPPYKARREARLQAARDRDALQRALRCLLEDWDRRQRLEGLPLRLVDGASGQCR